MNNVTIHVSMWLMKEYSETYIREAIEAITNYTHSLFPDTNQAYASKVVVKIIQQDGEPEGERHD